jgi:5-dehydro-2-deoxygluconokinase
VRRADDAVEVRRLHRIGNRRGDWPELCVLAFDHRSQMEELAKTAHASRERIVLLKKLLAAAGLKAGAQGMLIDGRYGAPALAQLTGKGLWLARPVEKPRVDASWPTLELEVPPLELRSWPREHLVKCLAFPDPAGLDDVLVDRLCVVQEAAHDTERELLIELIPKRGKGPLDHEAVPRLMRALYERKVAPDWWKLPAMPDGALWRAVDEVITSHDGDCRGVLVLGLEAPEAELARSFGLCADFPVVKGFAVGRTVWRGPATAWLSGMISDEALVERVSTAFTRLVELWRRRGVVTPPA